MASCSILFGERPRLRGPDDVVRFLRAPLGSGFVGLLVLGMGVDGWATGAAVMPRRLAHAAVGVAELTSCAFDLVTDRLVTVWGVAAGHPVPSALEVEAAIALSHRCAAAGLVLVDSVVISGHRWWSCRELAAQV